jgi:hypothetical protein
MSVTNYFNDKINNKPIAIIDNFFNEDILDNWLDYYQHKADFRYAVEEVENGDALLCHCLELSDVEDIFNMSETIMPLVEEYNKLYGTDLRYVDLCRAHINLITANDKFVGHTDRNNGMVVLWFANPQFKDTMGGFFLGTSKEDSMLVENSFNRLVVFPATMWHSIQSLASTDAFRITTYLGFSKEVKDRKFKQQNLVNKFNKREVVNG